MTETTAGRIVPGTTFTDKAGRVAQLHGIGVLRIGDRYVAWGEDKTAGGTFTAIACYSSPDLATWRFEGDALRRGDGDGDLAPGRVVERPKVLQRPDGAFVMLLHIDSSDYADARVGFAIADDPADPAGPYRYLGSERPLGNLSRDIGVYQEDGVGYLLSEDRDHGLHIYRLADDYLSVAELVATTLKDDGSHGYESPALVRHDGRYYLFGSDLTGWSTNDNKFATATSLAGPWSAWHDFAPPGSATFDSQVSTIVPVKTAAGQRYVYVGDRWLRDDLASSSAVWLPMRIADSHATAEWRDVWTLDQL
jgi:Glycosyl hydrolases family 43